MLSKKCIPINCLAYAKRRGWDARKCAVLKLCLRFSAWKSFILLLFSIFLLFCFMPLVSKLLSSIISCFLRKNRPEENNFQAVFKPCNERTSKAQGLEKQTPALHHSGASVFDSACEALISVGDFTHVF